MTAVFSSSSNFGLKKEIEIPAYRLQEQIKRLKSKGFYNPKDSKIKTTYKTPFFTYVNNLT
jgi:hypothetical protein